MPGGRKEGEREGCGESRARKIGSPLSTAVSHGTAVLLCALAECFRQRRVVGDVSFDELRSASALLYEVGLCMNESDC